MSILDKDSAMEDHWRHLPRAENKHKAVMTGEEPMQFIVTRQEILHALRLAQDALHMATLPFPVDEIKTQRALEAVTKVCDALGGKQ